MTKIRWICRHRHAIHISVYSRLIKLISVDINMVFLFMGRRKNRKQKQSKDSDKEIDKKQSKDSDVVSVSCFGVRVSVMFHFMFVHYTFSSV